MYVLTWVGGPLRRVSVLWGSDWLRKGFYEGRRATDKEAFLTCTWSGCLMMASVCGQCVGHFSTAACAFTSRYVMSNTLTKLKPSPTRLPGRLFFSFSRKHREGFFRAEPSDPTT